MYFLLPEMKNQLPLRPAFWLMTLSSSRMELWKSSELMPKCSRMFLNTSGARILKLQFGRS